MLVLVVGASGVVGRQLVPQLLEAGHAVVATTRSSAAARGRRTAGAPSAGPAGRRGGDRAGARGPARRDRAPGHRAEPAEQQSAPVRPDVHADQPAPHRRHGQPDRRVPRRSAGRGCWCRASAAGRGRRVGGPVKTEDDPLETRTRRSRSARPCGRSSTWSSRCVSDHPNGVVLRYGGLVRSGQLADPGSAVSTPCARAGSR